MIVRITPSIEKVQVSVNENGEFYKSINGRKSHFAPNPHNKMDALLIGHAYILLDRDHYTISGAKKVYALYQESRNFS